MGAKVIVKTHETTLTGFDAGDTGGKTLLQAIFGTAGGVVRGFGITFSGTDSSEPRVTVQIIRQTDAGTGGVTARVIKANDRDNTTLVTTANQGPVAGTSWSVEPSNGDIVRDYYVNPAGGGFHRRFDEVERIDCQPSGRIAVRVIADGGSGSVNCRVELFCEE